MTEVPDLLLVRTFVSVTDAHVARSVLDAAGIPTHLADDNIVAAVWTYSNAVGGVKLLAPADRWEEASVLLDTPPQHPGEAHDDPSDDACLRCGGSSFAAATRGRRWAALTWLVAGLPLVPVRRVLLCRRCGMALTSPNGSRAK